MLICKEPIKPDLILATLPWDFPEAKPLIDLDSAIDQTLRAIGKRPQTIMFDRASWELLKWHKSVKQVFDYSGSYPADLDVIICSYFRVERIVVNEGPLNRIHATEATVCDWRAVMPVGVGAVVWFIVSRY